MFTKKPITLYVDIETFSSVNIKDGLFKYTQSNDFEVLLFAYKIDDLPTKCIDVKLGEPIPFQVLSWLEDKDVIKKAWNAQFEVAALSKYVGRPLDPSQWRCTMVKAAYNGYPLSLDTASKALKLDAAKLAAGKDLIKFFCVPCKPTKKNENRYRNHPTHDLAKWRLFKTYCIRDVDAECEIDQKILLELPAREQRIYALDQRINKRGVQIDKVLVNNVIELSARYREHLIDRAKEITGLENPNSVQQLKKWLETETDEYIPSLDKENIKKLQSIVQPEHVSEILTIRQELALSSIKKFNKMLAQSIDTGHIFYQFQYYGAGTGRWAARGVQLHNLARNKLKLPALTYLRQLIRSGADHETLAILYDSPAGCMKELIRTAFVPSTYSKFVIGDFAAIEAVVLAWLAGEKWRLDAFRARKDIYIASIARMLHIPESEIDKDDPRRQRGKVSELSLGYQGAVGALLRMGAIEMGMKASELEGIVAQWRAVNQKIVDCWATMQKAFKYALLNPGEVVGVLGGKIKYQYYRGKMLMKLPSGRFLVYNTPEYIDGSLSYWGQNQTTKQWCRIQIYGGLLTENAVQAMARDLLADAMLRIDEAGYPIVLHVHDEIGCEVDKGDKKALHDIERLMSELPGWAKDIPVRAEVFETTFYRKG